MTTERQGDPSQGSAWGFHMKKVRNWLGAPRLERAV